jgi:hypothetical protein
MGASRPIFRARSGSSTGPRHDTLIQSSEHRIGVDTDCGSEGPLSAVAINDDGAVTVL